MRCVLDTSVLISAEGPEDTESAISVVSVMELHFGVLVASDPDERARRVQRLAAVEATFDPIGLDVEIAREWGRLAAAVVERGGQPRRRAMDLAIAATAIVERVPLMTYNASDFEIVSDLVEIART